MPLNLHDQPVVSGLSRSDVEVTTSSLKHFLKDSRWLGKTNRYSVDTIARLKSDIPLNPERRRNLAQYITASSVLHGSDGWGYLGRSLGCLFVGDPHRALHLAYYAELRACMSLLASCGIGVFSNQHFVISGKNAASKLESAAGTHMMAWNSLEFWAQQPSSGALFAELVRPDGISLSDWFQPFGGTSALEAQARAWFLQWGMDLSLLSDDRDARNESSYRPDGVPAAWVIPSPGTFEFIRDLWRMLQPAPGSTFQEIDRFILRLAVEKHFHGLTGKDAHAGEPLFVTHVNKVLAHQGMQAAKESLWRKFLLRESVPLDPALFSLAARPHGNSATDHLSVVSRAVLLLRMASGAAVQLIQHAGFTGDMLKFWWEAVGEARGLWPQNAPPEELSDLWIDIEDSLEKAQDIIDADAGVLSSFNSLRAHLGEHLPMLCTPERVALWALCS